MTIDKKSLKKTQLYKKYVEDWNVLQLFDKVENFPVKVLTTDYGNEQANVKTFSWVKHEFSPEVHTNLDKTKEYELTSYTYFAASKMRYFSVVRENSNINKNNAKDFKIFLDEKM